MAAEVGRPVALDPDPQPGDDGRLAALFEAHAAHVFDYCCSLLASRVDAAGAAAATLVTVYLLGDQLQDPSRLRAWLFTLARRECLSTSPLRAVLPGPGWDPEHRPGAVDPMAQRGTARRRRGLVAADESSPEQTVASVLTALPAPEREVRG